MQNLEILNLRLQNLAGAPSGGIGPGSIFYDTVAGRLLWRSTTTWIDSLKREHHEGTQLAETISDLPAVMRAVRLDEFAAPTAAVPLNGQKITGLADGTAATDAITRGQLDAQAATLRDEFADAVDAASKTLDEIDAPVAAVDLNAQKIINLANGTAAGDAINRGQLDAEASAIRGELTTATDAQSDALDTLAARTLDQVPAPAADVSLATKKIVNLANGTAAGDAINRGQLDSEATAIRGEVTTLGTTLRGETDAAIDALTNDLNGRSLEDFGAPTGPVDFGGQRITNLADGVNPTDGATVRQIEAAKAAIDWKDAVRVAASTDIPLTGLQTLGGITLVDGQRVLAAFQADATKRLIYIARTGAWEVAPDSVQGALTGGAYVPVMEGEHAGKKFRLATPDPITVGTTALDWQVADVATSYAADGTTIQLVNGVFSIKPGAVARKMEGVLGDGVATTFAAPHNFGTNAVVIAAWDTATGDTIYCGQRRTSTNVVTLSFATPPGNAAVGYTIQG